MVFGATIARSHMARTDPVSGERKPKHKPTGLSERHSLNPTPNAIFALHALMRSVLMAHSQSGNRSNRFNQYKGA